MHIAKKKNLWLILVIIAAALVNLVPSGYAPSNSEYFTDLEYLGLYNASWYLAGQTIGVSNAPLNTNHIFLTALKALPGDVFPVFILTVIYFIILGFSLWTLLKSVKNYGFLTAIVLTALLCTKKYVSYLFTLLPFGGIFTFFVATLCLLIAMGVKREVTVIKLMLASVFALAFAFYDNVTALCAIVLGVLIIRLVPICKTKALKITAVLLGLAIIITSAIFCTDYIGTGYEQNLENSVNYGIKAYDENAEASSYTEVIGYYFKNIPQYIKHFQSLLNNAFYENDTMPFSLPNIVKVKLIPMNVWIFGIIMLAIIAFAVLQHKKYSFLAELTVGNVVISLLSIKVSGIIYGISNLDKNLLLFNLAFDCMLCLLIVGITYIALSRRKALKEKYGVTQ